MVAQDGGVPWAWGVPRAWRGAAVPPPAGPAAATAAIDAAIVHTPFERVAVQAASQRVSLLAADAASGAAAGGGEEGEGAAADAQAAADAEVVVLAFMVALAVPETRRRLEAWVDVEALERLKQAAEALVAAEAGEPSSHEPRPRLARHATGTDRAVAVRRARAARAARARARGAAAAAASLPRRQAAATRLARDGAAATLQLLFLTDAAARALGDAATSHGRLQREVKPQP